MIYVQFLAGVVTWRVYWMLGAFMADVVTNQKALRRIWMQRAIPVVWRRKKKGQLLRIKLPYSVGNRSWLRNDRRIAPVWIRERQFWEVPKAWFDDFVNRALDRYGRLYVFQPYREQEKCSPSCQNAAGHECECSCMGANHGAGNDGSWFEVSDTFSTRFGDEQIACRLMVAKNLRE